MQEFEDKKRQWEEEAEAKTAKNRAKRQKKKAGAKAAKAKGQGGGAGAGSGSGSGSQAAGSTGGATAAGGADAAGVMKKRRLVNGAEVVFRKPGEEGSEDDEDGRDYEGDEPGPALPDAGAQASLETVAALTGEDVPAAAVDTTKITIIEED